MTATIKHPLSPAIPNSELKPHYICNQIIEPPTKASHIFQSSGLDIESPYLSAGQPSYFRPSSPAHQEHELNQESYFSPDQAPYNLRHEDRLGCGGKHLSNGNMSSNAIQPSPITSHIDLRMLNVEASLVESGYHDLTRGKEGYFQNNLRYSPFDGEFTHSGDSVNTVTPITHIRSTRSAEGNVSRVVNKQSSTIIKNGANGELVKVTRVQRNTRKRKGNGEKADKPKLPKLTKPLSELTRDYKDPIRDMECWVHRTAEVRRQEVEKREGYITRPMNSFMLYRSAFAERTKQWCLQNNHQVVSSVSGESWPLEPTAIREKYNELAKIERCNHQAAHPGYKFSPSKAQNSKKRKDPKEGLSDNERYIDDDDNISMIGGSRVRKSARGGKTGVKLANQIQGGGNAGSGYIGLCYDHMEGGAQRSSFTHNNPGKTPPICMGSTDMSGQYYQTTVRANSTTPISHTMHPAIIEDVTIRKTQAPTGVINQSRLYQIDSTDGYALQPSFQLADISKVDPVLLANEPACGSAYGNNCQLQNLDRDTVFPDEFIDEGNYEASRFDIDRLFAAVADSQIPSIHFPNDGVHADSIGDNGAISRFDARKLPGYDQNAMQGFLDLDNQEPWNVTGEIIGGDQFRYDEWLQ